MNQNTFSMQHPSLAGDHLPDVLRLIRTPNVGPVTFFQLMRCYQTAAEALRALPELSRRGGRKKPLVPAPAQSIEKEMELTKRFGARMICYGEPDYPALLHTIADAPPVITVLGNTHLWKRPVVGMVGARNASANGCHFAQRLAGELGRQEISVASGLARGIDSFAHKGSLECGTIAVIAGGIDNIYPPENEKLYGAIGKSGAIISEQPFGSVPFAGSFPGRNRIIAGMSRAVVVVEASPKSGSLITARLALEYDREVLAVPGSPMDPRSRGCNQLIKQGAAICESAQDIQRAISSTHPATLAESPSQPFAAEPAVIPPDDEVEQVRDFITDKLGITPVAIDTLIDQAQLPAACIMAALLELELAGRIRRNAGGMVVLIAQPRTEVPEDTLV